jgi:hypothetical protein
MRKVNGHPLVLRNTITLFIFQSHPCPTDISGGGGQMPLRADPPATQVIFGYSTVRNSQNVGGEVAMDEGRLHCR